MPKTSVVLLSGGLDSAVTLAMARAEGFGCRALTVRYGQRHAIEVQAAQRVARSLWAIEHAIIDLDLASFGGSALVGDGEVPKGRDVSAIGGDVPTTYVPARNTVLLSLALAYAEASGASDIFIGANAVDFSGYPDCRPDFLEAFERAAALGTAAGAAGRPIRIRAPLVAMTKADIVRAGVRLGVDFSLTHSCYDPPSPDLHCGACDACLLRRKGFAEAGVHDPTRYAVGAGQP